MRLEPSGWGRGPGRGRGRGVLLPGRLTLLCLQVGNKNDDPERKVVETEDAYKFAGQMGIQLFETSAKENVNVEEVWPGPERGGREGGPPCSLPHWSAQAPRANRNHRSNCRLLSGSWVPGPLSAPTPGPLR